MRTDLIGSEDIVAKMAALQRQAEDAQQGRDAAAERLKAAKQADIDAGAEALRSGSNPPDLTESEAHKALDDAERTLAVVALALRKEREALASDIVQRADDITASLADREDEGDARIAVLLDEVDELLAEKAEVRAHRDFVRGGAIGVVGRRQRVGEGELRTLCVAVASGDTETQREAWLRNYDAWAALVRRAHASVPERSRIGLHPADLTGLLDAAVEKEVEHIIEAGGDVPTPTSLKWGRKLGVGKYAGEPKEELTDMPPDTESAEARRMDLVKS